MRRLVWLSAVFLSLITIMGAINYTPVNRHLAGEKSVLVELVLDERVKTMLHARPPGYDPILLLTPNLSGVMIPEEIQGLKIRFMIQKELDELSAERPVDYMFIDRLELIDPYTAEVGVTCVWQYVANSPQIRLGDRSGGVYTCSKQSGEWVVTSVGFWVP